jgi:hypothetical protein
LKDVDAKCILRNHWRDIQDWRISWRRSRSGKSRLC